MILPGNVVVGRKTFTIVGCLGVAGICVAFLGINFFDYAISSDSPWSKLVDFFRYAVSPTLQDQNPLLPADATPFWQRLLAQTLATIQYACIAMSIAIVGALLMVSSIFMLRQISVEMWAVNNIAKKVVAVICYQLQLTLLFSLAIMRSIHEIIWALLFFLLINDSPLIACIALALPFMGFLGKMYSNFIESMSEEERDTSLGIRRAGGSLMMMIYCGFLPFIYRNALTYSLYRFECALRSSAILGFFGLQTIGLAIRDSYNNLYYRELWTELYVLLALIFSIDLCGSYMRKKQYQCRQTATHDYEITDSNLTEKQVYRQRPKNWTTKITTLLAGVVIIIAWLNIGSFAGTPSHLTFAESFDMFVHDIIPKNAVGHNLVWRDWGAWAFDLWTEKGASALLLTIVIATMALLIAVLCSHISLFLVARNLAEKEPWQVWSGRSKWQYYFYKLIGVAMRTVCMFCRSIPEYILVFLLFGFFGVHAWTIVITIAIHNFGILGRVWGEIQENAPITGSQHLYSTSGKGYQSFYLGSWVEQFFAMARFALYRWETCVRETTILGVLSISTLGYYIANARSSLRYDEMIFFVLLSTIVILVIEFITQIIRRYTN